MGWIAAVILGLIYLRSKTGVRVAITAGTPAPNLPPAVEQANPTTEAAYHQAAGISIYIPPLVDPDQIQSAGGPGQ